MMILKEFSRIVCVSLFSYQGSLFVCLSDSLFTLSHSSAPVKYFFQVFSRHFLMSVCRSQATCLLYHMFVSLSTIIFVFSKLFKLFNQKKQFLVTAQLGYHFLPALSTPFFIFLKKAKNPAVFQPRFSSIFASFFKFMHAKVSPAFISIRALPVYCV